MRVSNGSEDPTHTLPEMEQSQIPHCGCSLMARLTSPAPLPLTMISSTLALLFPKHTTLVPTLPGILFPSFSYDLLDLILWVSVSPLQRSFQALNPKLLTCHPHHNTWSSCTALALGQWFPKETTLPHEGTLGDVWRHFLVVTFDGVKVLLVSRG